ncbi:hypothetical protein FB381_4005 [Nocardioides albertanoniae]|uniref:Uncharacterized protein n=2 Tax=Nocardioides albertanoniae TaxID=1175486 RepID=A0A543ABY6_9ACTN|nr:hypothetical protein FB381_4005 [Nocardioides albertanoniae]
MLIRRLIGQDPGQPALVTTCAWERLRIDPVPGPRSRGDFVGLRSIAGTRAEVAPTSDTLPAGRSVLPRLAGDIDARLFVHDFAGGAVGLSDQLRYLAEALNADSLIVVDVGGDVVARGDEPGLLSPLADSLTLAASIKTGLPVQVAVLGPGVDGELTADEVTQILASLHAERVGPITPEDVEALRDVLEWHPTEATTLVAASAIGHRGSVDMRRGLDPVPMTDDSSTVWLLDASRIEDFPLAAALAQTQSLPSAEHIMRKIAVDELDYERRRAAGKVAITSSTSPSAVVQASLDLGASFITTRRLLEATNADCPHFEDARVDGLGLWSLPAIAAGAQSASVLPETGNYARSRSSKRSDLGQP